MPGNTTSTYNNFRNLFFIKNKYNFNLCRYFRGGSFAARGGGRG